jgi:hypothetical protein
MVRSSGLLWKFLTRLHGTNFCKTSARFAPSFVRQPNSTKCSQIVQNTPKHEFRSQGVSSVCSLWKIMTRLRGTNFTTTSAHFALSFVRQPNGPKCIPIVRNTPKHEFRVQWCGSGPFVAKNSDTTSWHELLHWVLGSNVVDWVHLLRKILTLLHGTKFYTTLAHFAPSFKRQPNGTKCTQLVRNVPKHEFRFKRG